MTEMTTKLRSDKIKLRLCRIPPKDFSLCFLPDWKALTLNEGDTKFQLRSRHRMMASVKEYMILMEFIITSWIHLTHPLFWDQCQFCGTFWRIEEDCES